MVTDGTQVKILAWYDNEWGYANRLVDLARHGRRRAARVDDDGRRRRGDLRNYILVTGAYWADTVADGASRMLVLFYFYQLGYTPFEVASLFLFYEVFGIITNLVGGWLAARLGLKTTLFGGLAIQILALGDARPRARGLARRPYVMASQALSGIAKDLTKMSSKSAVKLVVPEDSESSLFKWVAVLTGSKNALKGVGFFVGGLLLTVVGFQTAMLILAAMVLAALISTAALMHGGLGRTDAGRSSGTCSPTTGRSTCWPRLGSSCSPHATSGSWSASRSTSARSSAGASGRSARSSRSGSSATASCRRQRPFMNAGPGEGDGRTAAPRPGSLSSSRPFRRRSRSP